MRWFGVVSQGQRLSTYLYPFTIRSANLLEDGMLRPLAIRISTNFDGLAQNTEFRENKDSYRSATL